MEFQELEVTDFSGGITDQYIAGPVNKAQVMDNLIINNNKKPYQRPGSVIRDETSFQIPSGAKRIGHLIDHRDSIIEQSESNLYYFDSSYQTLLGPTSNPALGTGSTAETNYISKGFWNNHTIVAGDSYFRPVKIYKTGSAVSTIKVRTAGLPALATTPTFSAGTVGVNNYLYAFLYHYTYVVEGVTFEDFGPVTQAEVTLRADPSGGTPIGITGIPVLANGTDYNYDTANITVYIYRTVTDDDVFKFVGSVTNGTTTYSDTTPDATLADSLDTIYTTGDIVDNDPPPPAKFVHVTNNIALYCHVKEDGVVYPNRARQSIQNDIDSAPSDFILDFPDEIYGVNSIQNTHIVFCEDSCYRVDGFYDEFGNGGMNFLRISETVGCVSNDSIVQTDQGLFFAAKQGFYYTNGYSVTKISHHLDDSYSALISNSGGGRKIYGAFDKIENRIWWTTQRSDNTTDNDSCFILDLNYPVTEEATFTTASNGTYFKPTALLFQGEYMYRADTRGYLFKHHADYLTDPRLDTTINANLWYEKAIIYTYASCSYDFGSSRTRKFVPKILLTLSDVSNCAVQIQSVNDAGRSTLDLKPIVNNSTIVWGDPDIIWGDTSIIWNRRGLIEERRMMPATGLRCNYKQIVITNAYYTVQKSDVAGVATVDSTAKTATLAAPNSWTTDPLDYYLSFDNDSYDTQFLVTARTSGTVLTFADVTNLAPSTGSYSWLLKGYRKNESIEILSYVLYFIPASESQKPYQAATDAGTNA